ncbi:uncharacterized protein LOC6648522 [Drosophila willistoni]|uniref:uncharacterized protein LOC6648522 n=1 Tax=Drosophila willistoni TaxID=7260 RepID=UPI00017D8E0D|nr:uncharacterized protein LOC6648522 [Drosophila willistoni]
MQNAHNNVMAAICPLNECRQLVAHSHLLRHMINEHLDERAHTLPFQMRLREVWTGQRTLLLLAFRQLRSHREECLAILNWAGDGHNWSLCEPQLDLSPHHEALSDHLPILVMVSKTSWSHLLCTKQMKTDAELTQLTDTGIFYIFCLLAPFTSRPVYATLSVLNCELHCLRRRRQKIRNFATRMQLSEFISGIDSYFMTITQTEMDQLCRPDESAFLEIIINGESQPN